MWAGAMSLLTLPVCSLAILNPAVARAAVVEGGGYRLRLQECQRRPGMMQRIVCQVVITNLKTAPGHPVIFLKKGHSRAVGPNEQQFAADYVAIGQQKGYSNLIPRLNSGDSTTVALNFSHVPSDVMQFAALSIHYREDDGGSPYVGEYFAAVFQSVPILADW